MLSNNISLFSEKSIAQKENLDYFSTKSLIEKVLPIKPYCSNDLDRGLTIQKKDKAIKYKYIQINDLFIKAVIIDIDHDEASTAWLDFNTMQPNWITINDDNGHGHYCWILKNPIPITPNAHKEPIKFCKTIQYSLTKQYEGDFAYTGLITKNPLHGAWRTIYLTSQTYTLNELTAGLDLETPAKHIETGIGRNVSLFDSVRFWCYKNIKDYRNQNDYNKWYDTVFNITKSLNTFNEPLPMAEIRSIAKSVAKWIWLNFNDDFSNNKFSKLQSIRGKRSGIARKIKATTIKKSQVTYQAIYLKQQGYTYKDIANKLNVSSRTVINWLKSN